MLYDILRSILTQEESSINGHIRITRVQNECNLPSNRVRAYLEELRQFGLIESDSLTTTRKGRNFVRNYDSALRTLRRYGLIS